jgi:hypothetical protein
MTALPVAFVNAKAGDRQDDMGELAARAELMETTR